MNEEDARLIEAARLRQAQGQATQLDRWRIRVGRHMEQRAQYQQERSDLQVLNDELTEFKKSTTEIARGCVRRFKQYDRAILALRNEIKQLRAEMQTLKKGSDGAASND
jgi:hypothetical protein